jgi:hypothetical protein
MLPAAVGAGERAVVLTGNDAAVDWLRGHLAADDVVLVKASRKAHLDEGAAALASLRPARVGARPAIAAPFICFRSHPPC